MMSLAGRTPGATCTSVRQPVKANRLRTAGRPASSFEKKIVETGLEREKTGEVCVTAKGLVERATGIEPV